MHMKIKFAATAVALAAFSLPTMLSADDGLKYEDLVHCAATSLVVAQVLNMDDGAAKDKVTIEKMNNQAAALMAIASVGSSKETDVVIADTKKEEDAIIGIFGGSDKSKSSAFIQTEVPKCKVMGEAAVEVLAEKK
jgi:hypothetical protein